MALTLRLACLSVSWSASLTLQGDHNKLAEGTAIVINHGYAIFTLQIIDFQHEAIDVSLNYEIIGNYVFFP